MVYIENGRVKEPDTNLGDLGWGAVVGFRLAEGKIVAEEAHLQRLAASWYGLKIPFALDLNRVRVQIKQTIELAGLDRFDTSYIRLYAKAGNPGSGGEAPGPAKVITMD